MTCQIHLSCVSFVTSFSHSCFPFLYHTSFHCLISYFCCYVFPLYSILPPLCCLLSLCILFSHYFRYFFPPLDPPRAGSRYGHLLPPSSLIEQCDADPVQPQQQLLPHRVSSRALLCLNEADGQWVLGNFCSKGHTVVLQPFTLVFSFLCIFFKNELEGTMMYYMIKPGMLYWEELWIINTSDLALCFRGFD